MTNLSELSKQLHPILYEDALSVASNANIHWESLKNKTILITGASGLIGSYLVYTLLCANERKNLHLKVLGLVRNKEKAEAQFATLLKRADYSLIVQDVASPLTTPNINIIIHAASTTNPKTMITNPTGTIKANVLGTLNLLDYAVQNKTESFLYLSTREIYGNTASTTTTISEGEYGTLDPTLIRSSYPESKRLCETICSSYKAQFGIYTKVARLSHVYGPDINLGSNRVWGEFLVNEAQSENITLKSAGLAELAFTYVTDTVSALLFILLNGNETVYNVSDPAGILKIRELAELIAHLHPEKKLKAVFAEEENGGRSTNKTAFLNAEKLEKLGWRASVNINEGLMRCSKVFSEYLKNESNR